MPETGGHYFLAERDTLVINRGVAVDVDGFADERGLMMVDLHVRGATEAEVVKVLRRSGLLYIIAASWIALILAFAAGYGVGAS